MEYAVLKKVFPSPDLDKALLDLRKRGLLQYAGESQRYDMHPIVRRYAYDSLTTAERKSSHKHLANYFDSLGRTAVVFLDPTNLYIESISYKEIEKMEDLAPTIELYHHTVRVGNLDEAFKLLYERLIPNLYFQFGAYHLCIELLRALFLDGEDKPPRLKNKSAQAWALNELAKSYAMSGQPRRAVPLFEMATTMLEKASDKEGLAIELGNISQLAQLPIGALMEAECNQHRKINLCHEIGDEFNESVGHQAVGRVLSYRGMWQEAEQELDAAISIQQDINEVQIEGLSNASCALRFLLMAREAVRSNLSQIQILKSSIECAQRALELAEEDARAVSPMPRDYARAYWLLGAAYRANGVATGSSTDLMKAEENLSKSLNLCRQINAVDAEADILLDVARLRYAQGDFKGAQEKASEALMITERSGYVLQGADVNLFLATLSLEGIGDQGLGNREQARKYAETALKLAECEGGEYRYKVAYEEAEAMLEKLK
jgi:tetratricopeptide (TPR) repeat protein